MAESGRDRPADVAAICFTAGPAASPRWPRRSRRARPGHGGGCRTRAQHAAGHGARRRWWSWRPSVRTTCARCCRRARPTCCRSRGASGRDLPRPVASAWPATRCRTDQERRDRHRGYVAGRAARGGGPRCDVLTRVGRRSTTPPNRWTRTTSSGTSLLRARDRESLEWTPRTSTRRVPTGLPLAGRARPGVAVGRGALPGMPGPRVLALLARRLGLHFPDATSWWSAFADALGTKAIARCWIPRIPWSTTSSSAGPSELADMVVSPAPICSGWIDRRRSKLPERRLVQPYATSSAVTGRSPAPDGHQARGPGPCPRGRAPRRPAIWATAASSRRHRSLRRRRAPARRRRCGARRGGGRLLRAVGDPEGP